MLFKKKNNENEPMKKYEEVSEEICSKAEAVKRKVPRNLYEVAYKVKVVGSDNKTKTITKKVTIVSSSDTEAVIEFANGYNYDKGQVVSVKKLSMKDLRK